jgi:hypothetical protein
LLSPLSLFFAFTKKGIKTEIFNQHTMPFKRHIADTGESVIYNDLDNIVMVVALPRMCGERAFCAFLLIIEGNVYAP